MTLGYYFIFYDILTKMQKCDSGVLKEVKCLFPASKCSTFKNLPAPHIPSIIIPTIRCNFSYTNLHHHFKCIKIKNIPSWSWKKETEQCTLVALQYFVFLTYHLHITYLDNLQLSGKLLSLQHMNSSRCIKCQKKIY